MKDSFFISRQDHDYLLKHHQKFLLHLFETYESRWNIDGLIFKEVLIKDNVKLQKCLSSPQKDKFLQKEGVLL
jgi:hypothetical protein